MCLLKPTSKAFSSLLLELFLIKGNRISMKIVMLHDKSKLSCTWIQKTLGIELDEDKKEHVLRKDSRDGVNMWFIVCFVGDLPWCALSQQAGSRRVHRTRSLPCILLWFFCVCRFLHSFLLISLCFLCVNVVAFCMFMLLLFLFHARFIIC